MFFVLRFSTKWQKQTLHFTSESLIFDKVELARAFPDIAALKNGVTSDKTPLRGYNQGDIELYSNFGITYGQ